MCSTLSVTILCRDHDVKFFNATLFGGRGNKHTMMNFSFSAQTWVQSPRIQLQ